MPQPTCLVFHVDCGTMVKGALTVLMAFTVFVGSVYLLLSLVLGRWMGYLVLAVSFFGWMAIMSSIWFFGFFAQGPTTPTNQGPRGSEPSWVPISGGLDPATARYDTFATYPGQPWRHPANNDNDNASVQSVTSTVGTFLAEQLNQQLGIDPEALNAITGTQFTIENVRFATASDGKTPLAVAEAYFNGGGPTITVTMYHDSGSIPRYSAMILIGSIVLFGLHLPLLDRAEKKRKEFLTGGASPAWYGPA